MVLVVSLKIMLQGGSWIPPIFPGCLVLRVLLSPGLLKPFEIDFWNFWLLLGAPGNMWKHLESILAVKKWLWLDLILSAQHRKVEVWTFLEES